jgi:hypothetical protein
VDWPMLSRPIGKAAPDGSPILRRLRYTSNARAP